MFLLEFGKSFGKRDTMVVPEARSQTQQFILRWVVARDFFPLNVSRGDSYWTCVRGIGELLNHPRTISHSGRVCSNQETKESVTLHEIS